MSQEITAIDYVFDESLISGGYKVDNILHGGSGLNNENNQKGGSTLSVFKDLAVPGGLLLMQSYAKKRYYEKSDGGFLTEDIHNRLINLVDTNPNVRSKTRKRSRNSNNKTKKKK